MKLVCLTILLSLFTSLLNGQSDTKMEKTLKKSFEKENYSKCKDQALKFRKKQPNSVIPYYYLCKIELSNSLAIQHKPNRKQWRHLKLATNYTRKIKSDYPQLNVEVQDAVRNYMESWNDSTYTSTHVKSVLKTYIDVFNDTLDLYQCYYRPKPVKTEKEKVAEFTIPKTDSIRTELLKFASQWVGVPYVYAGEDPKTGFDCSGFVLYVYKHIGINLPHSSQMQSELDAKIISLDEAKPGDLIFFGRRNGKKWTTQHAGIFYGNENGEPKVIHCVSRGVCIDGNNSSWDYYWKDLILFVKRLPQLEP